MKTYIAAASIVIGALLSVSTQAGSVSVASGIQRQVTGDLVQKVRHCRRWSGGWGCHRW